MKKKTENKKQKLGSNQWSWMDAKPLCETDGEILVAESGLYIWDHWPNLASKKWDRQMFVPWDVIQQ